MQHMQAPAGPVLGHAPGSCRMAGPTPGVPPHELVCTQVQVVERTLKCRSRAVLEHSLLFLPQRWGPLLLTLLEHQCHNRLQATPFLAAAQWLEHPCAWNPACHPQQTLLHHLAPCHWHDMTTRVLAGESRGKKRVAHSYGRETHLVHRPLRASLGGEQAWGVRGAAGRCCTLSAVEYC
jgi:hypothetical protein